MRREGLLAPMLRVGPARRDGRGRRVPALRPGLVRHRRRDRRSTAAPPRAATPIHPLDIEGAIDEQTASREARTGHRGVERHRPRGAPSGSRRRAPRSPSAAATPRARGARSSEIVAAGRRRDPGRRRRRPSRTAPRPSSRRPSRRSAGSTRVVNNAGIDATEWKPVADWHVADFDEILRGEPARPVPVAKYAIPHLLAAGGGAIVHMSSVCAITVWAGDCGYDISKAGLNMLSDHIAVEYGPAGIRSNTLMPGVIATELHDSVMDAMNDGARVRARSCCRRHPIGRFGSVEEVADACVFLCADEARLPDRRRTSRSTAPTAGSDERCASSTSAPTSCSTRATTSARRAPRRTRSWSRSRPTRASPASARPT